MGGVDGARRDISILVVTGNREFAASCGRNLRTNAGFAVTTATSVGDAVDVLSTGPAVDCIISEYDLPDTDGVAFLELVRAQNSSLPFVLLSSEDSEAVATRAIAADVTEHLTEEPDTDQWESLAELVRDAVTYHSQREDTLANDAHAEALLDAAHDLVFVARGGSVEYLNRAALDLLDANDPSDAVGRPVDDILSLPGPESIIESVSAVQNRDRIVERVEAQLLSENGRAVPIVVTATRINWHGSTAVALVAREVSERRAYESELEPKERVLEEAPLGITIADATDPDHAFIYVNEAFEKLTGYPREEILGRYGEFLRGEQTDPEQVATLEQSIEAEEPVTVELRNYRKDGTEFWVRATIAPVENDAGEVTHYIGFHEDVTARKEDERMLRRFREVVDSAGQAIYITDSEGSIEYVNRAFERTTGYSASEAIGENPRLFTSGEMPDGYYEHLWETILAGEVWEDEIINCDKAGDLYHARQMIAPVTSGDDIEGFVAIQADISEQKERERQLRQYERTIESATELIAAVDDDYRLLFANPAYREFYDVDDEDLSGVKLPEIVGDETFESIRSYLEETLAGNSVHYRMTRSRPDRPDRTFDIRYYPLEDETGGVRGVVATLEDRTERVERETQLASLDRMLRHNLRNDLNAILSRAELIAETESNDNEDDARTIKRLVGRIVEQAEKEREIVELLTSSSLPETYDLSEMVSDAVARVERDHPDAAIRVDMPDSLPVWTIPELGRAIHELVENAVEHGDKDRPEVTISANEDRATVELQVRDNGPGIPSQERNVIADMETLEQMAHSGGMGLWLVKRIVTRANGTIRFDDAEPRGALVRISIPANSAGDVS